MLFSACDAKLDLARLQQGIDGSDLNILRQTILKIKHIEQVVYFNNITFFYRWLTCCGTT